MVTYDYAIVGGGMTAAAAIDGIRTQDPSTPIGLFSADRYPPYSRPPLSKGLWRQERMETIWRYPSASELGVDEHLNTTIVRIDPEARRLEDQQGQVWGFHKLLLATGGTPRTLSLGDPHIRYFRSLDDYLRLWQAAQSRERFFIIGGGFIGAEIAAALADNGKEVTMAFPEHGLLERIFPPDLSQFLTEYYRSRGITVLPQDSVQAVDATASGIQIETAAGGHYVVDEVVAGLGITPNTELAEAANLTVSDGIVVNARGQTSHPDIYAAGDVARFPAPALKSSLRVEHEDNALSRGRIAGINMAGGHTAASDLPFFYSDLFDLGFEAVGRLNGSADVYADWVEYGREGVLYYLDHHQVVGVLNWNVWDAVPKAQKLLADPQSWPDPTKLQGRIRNS